MLEVVISVYFMIPLITLAAGYEMLRRLRFSETASGLVRQDTRPGRC
jgi:hypothetical protein